MSIRAAVPDDIPEIMRLAAESDTAAHWSARDYDALFAPEAPERIALVACNHKKPNVIAGFVIARCGAEEWEIENVVVESRVRREGIGRLLLQEVVRRAHAHGIGDIFLEVRESNLAARALYEIAGFSEEGRRRGYYRNPTEDGLVLRLALRFPVV